ncbi:MAG: GNAT family N-acetyltransferase [Saccharofermentanales bacterium]|jgi:predicted GNAT family acetyltransferase
MDFIRDKNRIYSLDEYGKLLAEITYVDLDESTVEADHTYVDPSLRGHGIAEQLVEALVEEIQSQGKKIKPTCIYVVTLFKMKPDKYGFIAAD